MRDFMDDFWLACGPDNGASPFYPGSLFANGEQGAFFDPLAEVPLFVGDPVAHINDLSGNGNNVAQTVGAKMPTWQGTHYLFDGVDDSIAGAVGYNIAAPITIVIGWQQLTGTNDDFFDVGSSSSNRYQFGSRGGSQFEMFGGQILNIGAKDTAIHVATLRYNGAASWGRLDGVLSSGNVFTSNVTATNQRMIGARVGGTAENANFRLFGYVEVDRDLTAAEIADVEAWMKTRAGL